MDELLFAVLAGIAEILGDALLELFTGIIASILIRAGRSLFGTVHKLGPVLGAAALILAGAGVGALSAIIFPHPLVHPSRFHGISVIASPLLTGWAMSEIGRAQRGRDWKPTRIESFGHGFAFALAMSLVRFVMVG